VPSSCRTTDSASASTLMVELRATDMSTNAESQTRNVSTYSGSESVRSRHTR